MPGGDLLWHYTTTEAFLGIVRSKEIWLSEVVHSNDSMEGLWLIEHPLRKVLGEAKVESWHIDAIVRDIYSAKEFYNAFVFCLSEVADDLGQWRGYADDGRGIAIGFERGSLSGITQTKLVKVRYSEYEQVELLNREEKIKKILSAIEAGAMQSTIGGLLMQPSEEEKKEIQRQRQAVFEQAVNLALSAFEAKNPAFSEEKEWRLVKSEFPDQYPKGDEPEKFYDHSRDDLGVIVRPNQILPRVVLPLPIPDSPLARALSPCVSEVMLGPKNNTDERTLDFVLRKYDFASTRIRRSEASYR